MAHGFLSAEDDTGGEIDPEAVAWHRNRLIERLRARGLLETEAELAPTEDASVEKVSIGMPASELLARLVPHLDGKGLGDEHPVIIAHLLRVQDAALRVRVLRGLSGPQARIVMRFLRNFG